MAGQNWRIDHCKLTNPVAGEGENVDDADYILSADMSNGGYGLVDHCTIDNGRITPVAGIGTRETAEWIEDYSFGAANAIFVEDCTITRTDNNWGNNAIDVGHGGSAVFRFNSVNGTFVESHGPLASEYRGVKEFEVYGNVFSHDDSSNSTNVKMRGGTPYVWGNTFLSRYNLGLGIDSPRASLAADGTSWKHSNNTGIEFAYCDGDNIWDGNEAITALMGYGDDGNGTHSGANNAATLTDSTSTWDADDLIRAVVYNVTDHSHAPITDNDSTTITGTLIADSGYTCGATAECDWDTGDTYKVTNGYPCRDQIGRSKDNSLDSPIGGTVLGSTPTQELKPAYMWNNYDDYYDRYDTVAVLTTANIPYIKANRDYYDGTGGIQTSTTSPFNGTSGVGWGTKANRPTTCTTGVAYWATDEGEWASGTDVNSVDHTGMDGNLYICTATNTWSASAAYTPYTYPHPRVTQDENSNENYYLTVTKTGAGDGTVTSSGGSGSINCGDTCQSKFTNNDVVTLAATATGSDVFKGWSGEGCSGTGTCEVTMSSARNIVAEFQHSYVKSKAVYDDSGFKIVSQ
jgi:hypothetical protein